MEIKELIQALEAANDEEKERLTVAIVPFLDRQIIKTLGAASRATASHGGMSCGAPVNSCPIDTLLMLKEKINLYR